MMNLFPYEETRKIQEDLIKSVDETIQKKGNLIAHAPTGLGKTAATIAPALKYAIDNGKTVFFLTSRHTQHTIAIETLAEIKKKYNIPIPTVDMIGKKWMCSVPGVDKISSSDFTEYCKKQREESACEFFNNTKNGVKLTVESAKAIQTLKKESPLHIERFTELCSKDKLCAYELATTLASDAKVIIADYYYIFNPNIRKLFLTRSKIDLENCIVIVDEAHNLPGRLRELLTKNISNYILKRSLKELQKAGYEALFDKVEKIHQILTGLSEGLRLGEEKLVSKKQFLEKVAALGPYDELIEDLETAADAIRETERQAFTATIASFLDSWKGEDEGYVRIISKKQGKREETILLSYRCLDPSLVSKEVIENAHATILMSGTLTPTSMYKDVLGFPEDTVEKTFENPFPDHNKLSLIVPQTTTKYSMRNEMQFHRIGEVCAEITNNVPGNCALFFPSYFLRDQVYKTFFEISKKTAFVEQQYMTKSEKHEFLEKFKQYKNTGAVLLGIIRGNFGEGIDLPGDLLKCVVVVGLPLERPDLETKGLIDYYDKKFGRGWDYGYVFPAFNRTLQAAGRCIRSETDKGLIVFLDERYAWPNYIRCFPEDSDLKISKEYLRFIEEFF